MKRLFALVVALQLAFVAGEAAMYQMRVSGGDEVRLRVVPVDPRSLFMGHYMTLGFDISNIDAATLQDSGITADSMGRGESIWVGLEQGAGAAIPVHVTAEKPPRNELVYIKGRLHDIGPSGASVTYGIERYYISETRQQDVEEIWSRQAQEQADIEAVVSVDGSGNAHLVRILVNGIPF
jgi:uncharacterized membrane-anchored protein